MTRATSPSLAALVGLCLAAPLTGCKGKGTGPLARAEPVDDVAAKLPVPPADGPKIVAIAPGLVVRDRPSATAAALGELRVGAPVARSKEAYRKDDCEGGWYSVRPRGFVCAGPGATLDPTAIVRGLPPGPELGRALPYRYARARSENVPVYARAPSPEDQLASEPDLKKILGHGEDKEALGASANDVPLDPRGVASGPAVLAAGGEGIDGGKRTVASFFSFPAESLAPSFVSFTAPGSEAGSPAPATVKVGGLRKGSGVAVAGTVELESISGLRRFAVTPAGYLIPTDRLKPALGSTWHGIDLEKLGLPVAFVHKLGVHTFSFVKGKANKHDDEVERRSAVPLTGKFRTVDGVRYEETREGQWLRGQDVMVIVKRHKYPDFVKGSQKWIDVSIANQTLTAYEGTHPVYATLVSTGRDHLKDPAQSASTPRGAFRITGRAVTRGLDAREVSGSFDVGDAPWALETEGGFSLVGMYWGDGVGEAQTFHDVVLTPVDAHRLWLWAGSGTDHTGEIPEGWHGATPNLADESAAMVFVRP